MDAEKGMSAEIPGSVTQPAVDSDAQSLDAKELDLQSTPEIDKTQDMAKIVTVIVSDEDSPESIQTSSIVTVARNMGTHDVEDMAVISAMIGATTTDRQLNALSQIVTSHGDSVGESQGFEVRSEEIWVSSGLSTDQQEPEQQTPLIQAPSMQATVESALNETTVVQIQPPEQNDEPTDPATLKSKEQWEEREDSRGKKAQAYFEFKERIGRFSSSCGESYSSEMVAFCSSEFDEKAENYLRGCKWSPDGKVLLTNSNDNHMRLFHLPDTLLTGQWDVATQLRSNVKVAESDTVFDFCWYPIMDSQLPETCLFATTCRETPIHLFSAASGELIASYRPYNHLDEIVAAHSIGFTCDGKYLVSGFNRTLRTFHTNRPGRECVVTSTVVKEKDRRGKVVSVQGQRSILSCFAAHPTDPSVIAAGAFNGDVAIYDIPSGNMVMMFEGQSGGITHLAFSSDGNYLFAGGRKNPEINCFDIRNPEKVPYVLYRYIATNQRMYFDLDRSSRYLLSGHHNGKVSVWDLQAEPHVSPSPFTPWPQLDPVANFQAHQDAVNGCSINPRHPLLATCSGQRHYSIDILDEVVDLDLETAISTNSEIEENTLKLWNLKLPP